MIRHSNNMQPTGHLPWEYKLVSMGNPLEPDIEVRANAIGKAGWELVAIDAGVWVFKRMVLEEPATELQAIMEETVPLAGQETVEAMGSGLLIGS